MRNVGRCHDGKQRCVSEGQEFATWSACEGQEHDCGQPTEDCGCVPGTIIACDEDCSAALFCSLTGRKTCQPDGTWGPCRETNPNAVQVDLGPIIDVVRNTNSWCAAVTGTVLAPLTNMAGLTVACFNTYFGCCSTVPQGNFSGDCAAAFTCGHPPQSPD
jgi:hypothetical protein